jgi:hypothetical protein
MEPIRSCAVMKIRIMWTWHVARIGNMTNAYRVVDAKRERTGALKWGTDKIRFIGT